MKTPIVFFGASSYVIPLIDMLTTEYDLKLVITTEEKDTDAVPAFCTQHNIPFITVRSTKELLATSYQLQTTNSPVAILADFRLLVPQAVIDLFPKGIVNIHPSLLPEYRGPTPGTTALLDGKTTTGVSLMLLDKDLDHGPLIGQIQSPILPTDTSATLYPRLFTEGTALLKKVLPGYLDGTVAPFEQDHSKATYTDYLTRESGYIDLNPKSEIRNPKQIQNVNTKNFSSFDISAPNFSEVFERAVRAYFPWPTVWTRHAGESRLTGKIIKFLPEGKIQVEGKKPQSYKDFINGYPEEKEWLEKIVGK